MPGARIAPWLGGDTIVVLLARAIRLFAFGLLSVLFAFYLGALGLPTWQIGVAVGVALGSSALWTWILTAAADRIGRGRTLILSSLAMAAAALLLAFARSPSVVLLAVALGSVSPNGQEVGPFLAIEQTILGQRGGGRRVHLFAWYNLVGAAASALGALAVGLTGLIRNVGLSTVGAYRAQIGLYALIAVVLAVVYLRLSASSEAMPAGRAGGGIRYSRSIVVRLGGLFFVDALAGGFVVPALVAYWFYLRFGASLSQLGLVFFLAYLASGLSFFVAARLADRLGLLNTMVLTHLPSNLLLLLVAFMPTFPLAVAVFIARNALSQMDVPTRQVYSLLVVHPEDRSATSGLLASARNLAAMIAPPLSGSVLLTRPVLGLPFIVGGGLKAAYDLTLFAVFRNVPLHPEAEGAPTRP